MFLTEQEILDTPHALAATCKYFEENKAGIQQFFANNLQRNFIFFGCGSSYMLAKSGAALFASFANTTASAIPAGDYIVDPDYWKETVKNSIVVALSRSGQTSEMIRAVEHAKNTLGCSVIALTMKKNSGFTPLSSLELTMEWCYDHSVCQTRTVTNLYAAMLLLGAQYSKDEALEQAVKTVCEENEAFQTKNRDALNTVAAMPWTNVVVLADGPICGIAEEGALAFTEIAMLTGRYFHLLDYRHGPVVISDKNTLTIVLLRPNEEELQSKLVIDVKACGGTVVTASAQSNNPYSTAAHIQMSNCGDFAAWGIPFIYISQMLALLKAINLGGNPDAPQGLDPFITL